MHLSKTNRKMQKCRPSATKLEKRAHTCQNATFLTLELLISGLTMEIIRDKIETRASKSGKNNFEVTKMVCCKKKKDAALFCYKY